MLVSKKSLKNTCKRLKIKLTVKRNGKRIPKSKSVLIKQIKRRTRKIRRTRRRTRFGADEEEPKKSLWQKHKGKIKIAAGVALAVGAGFLAYKGHKHATKEENKEKFKKYNELVQKLPFNKRPPVTSAVAAETNGSNAHEINIEPTTEQIRKLEDEEYKENFRKARESGDNNQVSQLMRNRKFEVDQRNEEDERIKRQKKEEEEEIKRNKKSLIDHYRTAFDTYQQVNNGEGYYAPLKPLLDNGKHKLEEFMKEDESTGKTIEKETEQLNSMIDKSDNSQEQLEQIEAKKAHIKELEEKREQLQINQKKIVELGSRITDYEEQLSKKPKGEKLKNLKKKKKEAEQELAELTGSTEELQNLLTAEENRNYDFGRRHRKHHHHHHHRKQFSLKDLKKDLKKIR